jgi:hypothetical protein
MPTFVVPCKTLSLSSNEERSRYCPFHDDICEARRDGYSGLLDIILEQPAGQIRQSERYGQDDDGEDIAYVARMLFRDSRERDSDMNANGRNKEHGRFLDLRYNDVVES